jgi:hypothetical protein
LNLGFARDTGFDQIVRDYVDGLAPKASVREDERTSQKVENVRVNAVEVAA